MPIPSETKKDNFRRLFPPRVEKLVKQFKLVANCSTKSSYEYDKELLYRAWVEIGKHLQSTAKCFGVEFKVTVDGKDLYEIDTSVPKKKRTRKVTKR